MIVKDQKCPFCNNKLFTYVEQYRHTFIYMFRCIKCNKIFYKNHSSQNDNIMYCNIYDSNTKISDIVNNEGKYIQYKERMPEPVPEENKIKISFINKKRLIKITNCPFCFSNIVLKEKTINITERKTISFNKYCEKCNIYFCDVGKRSKFDFCSKGISIVKPKVKTNHKPSKNIEPELNTIPTKPHSNITPRKRIVPKGCCIKCHSPTWNDTNYCWECYREQKNS